MKLRKMGGSGAVAARKKNVLGVHLRSEFADQVSPGSLAYSTDPKTGFFSSCRGCFAYGGHLQGRNNFAQIEADRGSAFGYGMHGILAAENDPLKLLLLQFMKGVVELVKVERWLDPHHGEQDRLGAMQAQSVRNRMR